MKKYSIPILLTLVILITTSCGLIPPPAPQSQPPATDLPPRATAMSELPPTWTPVPTLAPSPTVSPSPTPLPTQDPDHYLISLVLTPAAVQYPPDPDNRAGWKVLEGKTASLSIPPTYEVLDFAGVFMEMMYGVMEAFAESFTELALDLGEELGATPSTGEEIPELGDMPEIDFIIAIEEASQSAIILASSDLTPGSTTEDLLNQALSNTDANFKPVSRQVFQEAPFPMERVILDVEDPELGPGKQVIYVILGEQKAWNVVFTTPADLFDQQLPLFESCIQSFTESK